MNNILDLVTPVEMTGRHVRLVPASDDWPAHDFWRIKLTYQGRDYHTVYRTGLGFRKLNAPVPPTLASVLWSLRSDALGTELTFNEWCNDLGENPDSRKALAMFRRCCTVRTELIVLFGEERFERLLGASE